MSEAAASEGQPTGGDPSAVTTADPAYDPTQELLARIETDRRRS